MKTLTRKQRATRAATTGDQAMQSLAASILVSIAGRRTYKRPRISVALKPVRHETGWGEEPLGVLLQQALEIVNGETPLSSHPTFDGKWLVRQVLRNGLENIIRTGRHTLSSHWKFEPRQPGFRFAASRD